MRENVTYHSTAQEDHVEDNDDGREGGEIGL